MLVKIYLRTGPPIYVKKMIDWSRSIYELEVLHDQFMTVHIDLTWMEAIEKSFNGFRIDANKYYVRRVRGPCGEPPHTLTEPISILLSEFKKLREGKKYSVQIMSFDAKVPFYSVAGGVRNDLSCQEYGVKRQRTHKSVQDNDRADETDIEEVTSQETGEDNVVEIETMTNQELETCQVHLSRPPPPVSEYQNGLNLQQRNSTPVASRPNSIPQQFENQGLDPNEVKAKFLERAEMTMTNSQNIALCLASQSTKCSHPIEKLQ
ncbi:uncharacterized protein LOC110863270 isoform X2 [Folsomia candida]|uniref:uncharacterized protein LOC110863270 isoform X2 n=1 Tax=Folsomia candida TaxID=158441 RepID=UPI000B8FBFFE|nr:uncharacterized protein LOC110863270 isoform X2 [Folsomia candida]